MEYLNILCFNLKALLENESIDEAIELTEHSGGAGMSDEKFLAFSQTVFQKAGFIKFSHMMYQEAQEYFIRGKLDVREVSFFFIMYIIKANSM